MEEGEEGRRRRKEGRNLPAVYSKAIRDQEGLFAMVRSAAGGAEGGARWMDSS